MELFSILTGVLGAISSSIIPLANYISGLGTIFKIISGVANIIGSMLSPETRIDPEERAQFSYACEQNDIKPENYEKAEDYVKAGKEAMENMSEGEKEYINELKESNPSEYKRLDANAIATTLVVFTEKYELSEIPPLGFFTGIDKLNLDEKKIEEIIEKYHSKEIPTLDIEGYLDNKLNTEDSIKMYEVLKEKIE